MNQINSEKISAEDVAIADNNAQWLGIPLIHLMECAGYCIADEIINRYKLKDKSIVRGVTTIIGDNLGWNKGALIGWARREATAGRDPYKVRDKAADVGTITHFIIECLLLSDMNGEKVEPDLSEFAPADVEQAENRVLAFIDWHDKHKVKAHHVEHPRVSEYWKYGGTCDFDGEVDGEIAIVDYKSGGKNVYVESKVQGAALGQLYFEETNVLPVLYILRLGDDGEFQPVKIRTFAKYWDIFYYCLQLDKLRNEIK